jgi:hypothetical protein
MLTFRTMKQIPTHRTIPGFRSISTRGHGGDRCHDQARMISGQSQLLKQEAIRQWRNQMWQKR